MIVPVIRHVEEKKLKEYAKDHHYPYIDHWKAWKDVESQVTKKELPNKEGNEVWASFMVDYQTEGYLKIQVLADEIHVSFSTLQNDLKDVKDILSRYDLQLVKKPNYGLY